MCYYFSDSPKTTHVEYYHKPVQPLPKINQNRLNCTLVSLILYKTKILYLIVLSITSSCCLKCNCSDNERFSFRDAIF